MSPHNRHSTRAHKLRVKVPLWMRRFVGGAKRMNVADLRWLFERLARLYPEYVGKQLVIPYGCKEERITLDSETEAISATRIRQETGL